MLVTDNWPALLGSISSRSFRITQPVVRERNKKFLHGGVSRAWSGEGEARCIGR
jgi:hypothetical protein